MVIDLQIGGAQGQHLYIPAMRPFSLNWGFEKNSIATTSRKTRKSMGSRPVSVVVMAELSKYVCGLDVGQEKLFNTKFNHRKWHKICKEVGLTDLKFHDLRNTFGSVLAQNGVSTAVTQKLLEHSSPNLTNKIICRPFSQIGYTYFFSKPQFKENGLIAVYT